MYNNTDTLAASPSALHHVPFPIAISLWFSNTWHMLPTCYLNIPCISNRLTQSQQMKVTCGFFCCFEQMEDSLIAASAPTWAKRWKMFSTFPSHCPYSTWTWNNGRTVFPTVLSNLDSSLELCTCMGTRSKTKPPHNHVLQLVCTDIRKLKSQPVTVRS